jgi:hypothetical protein
MQDPVTGTAIYVNKKTGQVNQDVPRPHSLWGGKFAKSKSSKRKCVRSRTKSMKPWNE